ncbi:ABC transporter ATP-binding protein [Saccharolobus islandicus]|uniref:Oligopeptide/dipeptide ABC transporter, ATPase subunit n=1 Tax=Saccharolobus islandicus (strain L.D.8.5 / Lassen \|nr:ABC transporter ATP-binding protein [Sulfolobus islandicus]ADB86657.1 oligopeptide/dipeptide ABC transporter, ATPase subunit [Sulfolobus islandicus L.D.8.5]
MNERLLEVRDLTVNWYTNEGYVNAVDKVSFELYEGEILGLLGESGAGKSTVGQAILGLIKPPHKIEGEIIYRGKNVLSMEESELTRYRWTSVSMIFQAAMNVLDPVLTIEDNLYQLFKDKGIVKNKKEAKEKILNLLKKVNLQPQVAKLYPYQLSGGMKQRVVIALAIATNPEIIIADEPTTALDLVTQFSILNLLRNLIVNKTIKSIIFISHDLPVHAYISDRIIIMYRGKIIEEGKKEEVIKNPLHPYSKILLSTLKLNRELDNSLIYKRRSNNKNNGCKYANFCPYVSTICIERSPPLINLKDYHKVACFLYE